MTGDYNFIILSPVICLISPKLSIHCLWYQFPSHSCYYHKLAPIKGCWCEGTTDPDGMIGGDDGQSTGCVCGLIPGGQAVV